MTRHDILLHRASHFTEKKTDPYKHQIFKVAQFTFAAQNAFPRFTKYTFSFLIRKPWPPLAFNYAILPQILGRRWFSKTRFAANFWRHPACFEFLGALLLC